MILLCNQILIRIQRVIIYKFGPDWIILVKEAVLAILRIKMQ